jgi:hypothetical protein
VFEKALKVHLQVFFQGFVATQILASDDRKKIVKNFATFINLLSLKRKDLKHQLG